MSKLYYKDVQYIPTVTPVNDSTTAANSMWSSNKISGSIVKPTRGTDYYTDSEVDTFTFVDLQYVMYTYGRTGVMPTNE